LKRGLETDGGEGIEKGIENDEREESIP